MNPRLGVFISKQFVSYVHISVYRRTCGPLQGLLLHTVERSWFFYKDFPFIVKVWRAFYSLSYILALA